MSMESCSQRFTEKYHPQKLGDVIGQKNIGQFEDWFKKWKPGEKVALLWGDTGNGKTASVHALAKEKNLELIEINASDKRNAESINRVIGHSAKQRSLFKRCKIILIDEIDGVSGREDRGGVGEVIKIIKESKYPIVLTANDAYNPKLKSLRNYCKLIQFGKVHMSSMAKRLGEICESEKIECEKDLLKKIARESGGDLRSAINDLETVAYAKKGLKINDLKVLGYREKKQKIFDLLKVVFKTKNIKTAVNMVRSSNKDPDEIFWWIEQNITSEYEDPKEIAKAYEALSKADLFRKWIRIRQNWRFRKYMIDMMCGGVALAKKDMYRKFTMYRPPSRLLMYGMTKGSRKQIGEICERMSKKLHVSSKVIKKDYFPVFKLLFKNKEWKQNITEEFGLDKDDLKLIR